MRMVCWVLAPLFLTTILGAMPSAAPDSSTQIDALFTGIDGKSPGAAVLVIKDGKPVFQRGYGVTDLRSATH